MENQEPMMINHQTKKIPAFIKLMEAYENRKYQIVPVFAGVGALIASVLVYTQYVAHDPVYQYQEAVEQVQEAEQVMNESVEELEKARGILEEKTVMLADHKLQNEIEKPKDQRDYKEITRLSSKLEVNTLVKKD